MNFTTLGIIFGAAIVLLIIVGLTFSRLYQRATRDVSLVRTGMGGRKVIMDGGALVIPVMQEVVKVNMKTLKLSVQRFGESALITKDKMRVDAGVEFFVSVQASAEGIAQAAQTLGDRTFDVEALREMIEGKLVDGLRAVAATQEMQQLHENRQDFVQEVTGAVTGSLEKNGLELESVSLTELDQTPFENLDENNIFNAEGMKKQAEVVAESKKKRQEIESEANTAIREAQLAEKKRELAIQQQEEDARIQMEQEIEQRRADQEAEIAKRREASQREQEEARIDRQKAIEVAEQERKITVNEKSQKESEAKASADKARALARAAEEEIETAGQVAEAERQKRIEITRAEQEAEKDAVRTRVAAAAEKEAAEARAEAVREAARGDADAITLRAEAKKADMLAEAEGRKKIVEADNSLSQDIISMKIKESMIAAMPSIVAAMAEPFKELDSFKIHQINGMGTGGSNGVPAAANSNGSVVNQAFDAVMNAAVQLPALKKMGEELGMSFDSGVSGLIGDALTMDGGQADAGEAAADSAPGDGEVTATAAE